MKRGIYILYTNQQVSSFAYGSCSYQLLHIIAWVIHNSFMIYSKTFDTLSSGEEFFTAIQLNQTRYSLAHEPSSAICAFLRTRRQTVESCAHCDPVELATVSTSQSRTSDVVSLEAQNVVDH